MMFNSLMYDLPFAFLIDPFHAINEMFHSIISMFYDLPNSEQLTRTFAIRVAIIGNRQAGCCLKCTHFQRWKALSLLLCSICASLPRLLGCVLAVSGQEGTVISAILTENFVLLQYICARKIPIVMVRWTTII